nr:hypothetical protein PMOPNHBP_00074 [Klebsiella pneumoniae]
MKKLIPAIIAAALLSGCATQNDAVALSNRISDQQKQINALSVRLQSAEHRLSQQESASRPETFDKLFYGFSKGDFRASSASKYFASSYWVLVFQQR